VGRKLVWPQTKTPEEESCLVILLFPMYNEQCLIMNYSLFVYGQLPGCRLNFESPASPLSRIPPSSYTLIKLSPPPGKGHKEIDFRVTHPCSRAKSWTRIGRCLLCFRAPLTLVTCPHVIMPFFTSFILTLLLCLLSAPRWVGFLITFRRRDLTIMMSHWLQVIYIAELASHLKGGIGKVKYTETFMGEWVCFN